MPFPTTSIQDTFTRSDQDPDTGSFWGGGIETTGIGHRVVSNQAAITAGSNIGSRTAATYGPNCEVYCTIPTLPGDSQSVRLGLRLQELGGFNWDGYEVQVEVSTAGNETLRVREILNQSPTTLASDTSRNLSNGDRLGGEIIGSAIKLYTNESGAGWTERISTSDSTYSSANYLGLFFTDSTARVDDFGGGTVVAAGGKMTLLGVGD
jgi:hypothetical protein